MNFELGGHIIWNVEPKKKEGKRPSKKDQQVSTEAQT